MSDGLVLQVIEKVKEDTYKRDGELLYTWLSVYSLSLYMEVVPVLQSVDEHPA